jgi:hypothetical protein
MVEDLLARGVTRGKTRGELRALLGEPDIASGETCEYTVDTGQRFFGSPWMYRLVVRFDAKDGGVVEAFLLD